MAPVDTIILSPFVKAFLAGSISGSCSTVLFQPLDLVKTRLQNTNRLALQNNEGMLRVVENVVRTETFFGLWKGITPSMLRCVPGVGLYFGSMNSLKSLTLGENSTSMGPVQSVLIGAGARSISGVLMIPMTVIKTRFESGVYSYSSVTNAMRTIYVNEGVKGLTCGLIPTLLRDAPFSGLYLMFYTQLKLRFPAEWREGDLASVCHFSSGVLAGLLAAAFTQPFDVIKTKVQLYPNKFNSLLDVIQFVHRKYGFQGYFKGLAPRLMRRTLMAAMAWTVYERMMSSLSLK